VLTGNVTFGDLAAAPPPVSSPDEEGPEAVHSGKQNRKAVLWHTSSSPAPTPTAI
jgi:hypothetical protein